jgi:hypothetical protein
MRLAYLYNDKDVYIEFSEEKFRELFKKYFEEEKDIDKALDRIITDLKVAIRHK